MLPQYLQQYKEKKAEAQRIIRQTKIDFWEKYCATINRFTPLSDI